MKKSRLILLSSAIAICPAMIPAQTASLEICNNGHKEIDVAVAARIQLFITGYKWKSTGWYAVPARDCAVVYSEDYEEAGPITPQSGARIAYTVVNSEGVWGAYLSSVKNGGWMRSGTGDICVRRGEPFEFTRPAGDPAADCEGMTIPVADEFLPDHAGKYTVTMAWEGDRFFTPLGTGQPAAGNTPQKPPEDSVGMQVLKALAKAAEEESRKKQEADAASAESQRQAQTAQEQRQADPPPVAPPVAPTAPATPSPAPANTPDDDPIGSGGAIAPPTTFNALMCVPAGISNDSAWSAPEAGSKMAAFRDVVAQYIVSIAKPGWEYWVIPGQYESFHPASPTSGNQIVSIVSPESGRFDEFDPKCPSGYSGYWVKVNR